MAVMNKFECFARDMAGGEHDFANDVFKLALTNTAPDEAADTVFADIIEIADGNGYAAGGLTLDNNALTEAAGVAKVTIDDKTITAAGGAIGPFRYLVVYNDTAAGDLLCFHYDYGSALTLADGESLAVDFDGVNGVFTVT
jgi:hypothetical protein